MTLPRAQRLIVSNWVALAKHKASSRPTSNPPPTAPAASCTASAQYSSRHSDYDVYVHSNQPDQTVTVTAPDGASKTWHTDSSGYADVTSTRDAPPAEKR